MKILVCFDSFKGCLTAREACWAARTGIEQCRPEAEVLCLPMSDGGEGLVECLQEALDTPCVEMKVHGPLMEPRTARYLVSKDGETAYMEMAEACGLPLVPPAKRNPMLTTTYGVGEMLLDAVGRGCRHIIMGIGGSATCDGGEGMVRALEGHLQEGLGKDGCLIDGKPVNVTVASDVTNPLYGPQGASYVFSPQKGATAEQVKLLDERLREFASKTELAGVAHPDLAWHPGAGAAGGLGYALMAYLKAELCPGIDLVLGHLGFDRHLDGTDLVLTGEGKSDVQTLMGKVPDGVMRRATRRGVPVFLLSGRVENVQELLEAGFAKVVSINQGDDRELEELMNPEVARDNLSRAVGRLMEEFKTKAFILNI